MLAIHVPIVIAGLFGGGVTPPTAHEFASPRIIVLHGGSLERPIYLTNPWENLQFMLAIGEHAPVRRSSLDTSDAIQVAMFWGTTYNWHAQDTTRLPQLLGSLGSAQQAALYLPPRAAVPYLDYHSAAADPGVRHIAPIGLAVLHKAGLRLPSVTDSAMVAAAITAFHAALTDGDSTGALS